jgi:uncharacterized protein (DUF3084 family)
MAATNPADQFRIELENVIGPLTRVEVHLRIAQMKLAQWARTDYEADILREMIAARKETAKALNQLAQIHPNGRDKKEECH